MALEEQDQGEPNEEPAVSGGTDIEVKPDPPAKDPPEGDERPSRKERREDRGRGLAAERNEFRERAERAEREAQSAREAVAELRGRFDATEKARAQSAPDPYAERLAALRQRINQAVVRMGQSDPNAEAEWHDATEAREDLLAERRASTLIKESEERTAKSIPQALPPQLASIISDYPFIGEDGAGKAVANGHVARLVANESRDMNNPTVRFATLREAAALAARDLKLPGARKEPSQADVDRVSGTRGGDSGAGHGGAVRVRLSEGQMKLAESTFRNLPKEEAHQKWWKEIGVKAEKK